MPSTRRAFCTSAALAALTPRLLHAQTPAAHINIAAVEHDRILAEADRALTQPPHTLTAFPAKSGDPHDFQSEAETPTAAAFRAHADALIAASAAISSLTAAFVLTQDARYALHAGKHFYAWFVDPETRMNPNLQGALPHAKTPGSPTELVDAVSLGEIARSLPFLVDTAALSPPDLATTRAWFTDLLQWLTTARSPLIARDLKDHTASAWLYLVSAIARLLADEPTLTDCRHRFKSPTLRNQATALGVFPREVSTAFPLRNSLLNFDLLAATCDLLSTPFSTLWPYELEDGPGMRAVAAFLFPLLKEPVRWPYPADSVHFRDVPRRRPGLLFAGRAFSRPEYIELWRALPAPTPTDPLRASFPIRQPLLWVTRAPHTTQI